MKTLLLALTLLPTYAQAITVEEARTAQAEIRAIVPYYNARTGHALDAERVFVYDSVMPMAGGLAGEPARIEEDARGILATSNAVARDSFGTWYDDPAGGYCLIIFSRRGLSEPGALRRSLFAHELFHCYQHAAAAPVGLGSVAKWITEGQAEWAGETYANDSLRASAWFATFLRSGFMSLFDRDYDAMPFYAHAFMRLGEGLWTRLLPMVRATNNANSFEQAIQFPTENDYLQTWPMSVWQDETKGPEWTIALPGGATYGAEFPRETLRAGDVREFDAATVQHFTISVRSDKMYRIRLNGAYGGLSTDLLSGEVVNERLGPGVTVDYCFSSEFDCRCPNGSPPVGIFRQLGRNSIDIAVTASARGVGSIEIEESDPACCGTAEGSVEAGLVGTWRLVPREYAYVVFPLIGASARECEVSGSGVHTMNIQANGGVYRTTSLTSERRCMRSGFATVSSEHTAGSSYMCMRTGTTAGGPTAFYSVSGDSHVTDVINESGALSQPYNSAGTREPPSLAPYVGYWGGTDRELRGSYLLIGDDLYLRNSSTEYDPGPGLRHYVRVAP